MARSIWTGSISFGLVSVPVKLISATESKELRFHFLHKKNAHDRHGKDARGEPQ